MQEAYRVLQDVYGYEEFRLHQRDVITSLLNGRDAFVLMPTGGGKSLCYQIPAMVRDGVGIVVSPLIALMQDQVDSLCQLGVRAAFMNSSLSAAKSRQVEHRLMQGELDLLYVAPERLLQDRTLAMLDQLNKSHGVALLAIDEAHCVSQWGHDFRPEYRRLSVLSQRYPDVPRLALTATADVRTRDEIIEQLSLRQADIYINSFDRPNIHYSISEGSNARKQLWAFLLENHPRDAGIVYCLSRKKVEQTAEWLARQGRTALPYHAGLSADVRRTHQERFLREDGVIIVATIAFGMGIDKPDVRFVAHLSLPKSIEAYYQETGRAGRDGLPANAWMAYGLQEAIMLRKMMTESTSSAEQQRVEHHKLDSMLALCESTTCRRQALLAYLGEGGSAACGNCDTCCNPPQTWDATTAAQKALSCVVRTGQRFGVTYVTDVLLGKETDERIVRNGHDHLSTFGIGSELSQPGWRVLFRQLIALGYLEVDLEAYGSLRLTELARPLLKGEKTLQLRTEHARAQKQATVKTGAMPTADFDQQDRELWDALRDLRIELAQEQQVPPYVIFHDRTLLQMVEQRPRTLQEMSVISGVGQKKLERYGSQFLTAIN